MACLSIPAKRVPREYTRKCVLELGDVRELTMGGQWGHEARRIAAIQRALRCRPPADLLALRGAAPPVVGARMR